MRKDAGPDPSENLLLAIDNGTQSVRALLFDLHGNLLEKSRVELEPYTVSEPGWAEQDPHYYWRGVCEACRQLWPKIGALKQRIAGMALTTQRATVINLDAAGEPLRPAITWLDQRRSEQLRPIGYGWDGLFRLIGQTGTVNYFRREAESNWLRWQQPAIWEKTHKYLLLSGFVTYRLCGDYVDSAGSQVGYLPFDYRRQRWCNRLDWKWPATGIERSQLPELRAPGSPLGTVSAGAAAETGLPEGLPIIAAAADKACEIIGSGCVTPDIGAISYGTTATINTTSRNYVEAIPFLPAYPSAMAGAYCTEIQVFRGFWMVNWFKKQFGMPEVEEARRTGVAPEQLFDRLIEGIPPGSMGLMLQPYWTPGVKVPAPEAKGAIVGFGDVHTRAHIYRAILEGLAFALREGAGRIEKRSGVKISSLRVSGGGSQSDRVMQITADIFGIQAVRPHTYETSGLGAAIDAAVGLGFYPDFETAISAMTRAGDVFTPDPVTHQLYDRLYREVYCKMYDRLSPLYRSIARITGYPKL